MSFYALHLGQIISNLPNHTSFSLSEVLIWFRDGAFRDGHGRCGRPTTGISQEVVLATIMVKRQFRR